MYNTRTQSTTFCIFKLLTLYCSLNRALSTPFREKILSEEKKLFFLYWDLQLSITIGNNFQNPSNPGRENLPRLATIMENCAYNLAVCRFEWRTKKYIGIVQIIQSEEDDTWTKCIPRKNLFS